MDKDILNKYRKAKKEAEMLNKKIKAMDKSQEEKIILKRKLSEMKRELGREKTHINSIINDIDDCIIRQVVVYRYFDGLKWSEVAEHMGNCYCGDTLRIMTQRYMNKKFFSD